MTLHAAIAGWLLGAPSGANRRLLSLLQHAGPRLLPGERITVLHRPDYTPPALPGIAWQPIAIPAGPTFRRVIAERRRLPAALRTLGATVFDHGFLPLPRTNVPCMLIVHDVRAVDGLGNWPRSVARAVLRSACARAAVVVTPSEWTASRLRALGRGQPPVVIGNGVELPSGPAPAATFAVPPTGYLLHSGHLEPRKNLAVVVRALQRLPHAARPELWLAGHDTGIGDALAQQAQTAGTALRRCGRVDDAQLAMLYAHARAVVVPSRHEGFGLPVLEAFAHGRPVLFAAGSALTEVAAGLGVELAPDDDAAWAAAIADCRDHDDDRQARRAHAARHGWSPAADQWLALLRSIGGGGPAA